MVTGADGKPYYYNKKSGEVSWNPPAEGSGDRMDIGDVKEALKDGWRRTKQQAAVKVFRAAATEDREYDSLYGHALQARKPQLSHTSEGTNLCILRGCDLLWLA